jgi:carboxypeptidase D
LGLALSFTTAAAAQVYSFNLPPGKGAGPRLGLISQVELVVTNRHEFAALAEAGYDVAAVAGNRVTLFADADEVAKLVRAGLPVKTLALPLVSPVATPQALGEYNGYSNLTGMLDGYATNFRALCRKVSIGQSAQGRQLWALKLTSNPDTPADKPKFKYISTMHGNEPLGTEMCLYLIDHLLQGYCTNDPRSVNLLNSVELWVLPLMNPDGREANPPQRYNANGYDLNRCFPEGSATNLGNVLYGSPADTYRLQPEVQAVAAWTLTHHFCLGANLHCGSLVVNYPYDNDNLGSVPSPAPDDAPIRAMALTYASNNAPMWTSPYFLDGIVNGAAWYTVSGGMQDWNYRYAGCFDVTIELADYQWPYPPASELPTYWSQNQESMLAYLEWSLRGVRGILRNARTRQPVGGAVRVEGYPHLVFSDPAVGDYHRILLPGTYTLWFYAPGYVPRRIPGVVVSSGSATRVDVALQPVSKRFAAKINFQPLGAAVPTGFLADNGAAFRLHAGGYSYGWDATLAAGDVIAREAGCSQDPRYDSLCQMQADVDHSWEISVPNGPYAVLVAAGDPAWTGGLYRIAAEGVPLLEGSPIASNRWVEGIGKVVVTDGRLRLANGHGAVSNRLAFVELSAVEPATIAEWRCLFFGTTNDAGSAADFADPDGDGIPNLLEYAYATSPVQSDPAEPTTPAQVVINQSLWVGFSFPRNPNATDLTYAVQAANDLSGSGWTSVATYSPDRGWSGSAQIRETTIPGAATSVTVLDTQPVSAHSPRFLRLQVSRR